jgi:CDP-paratose 2-epimerase
MHDHNKPDIAPIDVAGDGKQVRDLLNVDDACFVYFMAAHTDTVNGKYNLGGGLQNSRSIAELFQFLAENFGYEAALNHEQERKSDQKYFVASNASISKLIDWRPKVDWRDGVLRNIDWVNSDAS